MLPFAILAAQLSPRFDLQTPLPGAPGLMVDTYVTGIGNAQQVARSRGLQARILWIDGTANLDRVSSEAKIVDLARTIHDSGFNTVVFDVKPISGQVLYKSQIAPKILEWKGKTLPADFDPLPVMIRECKRHGLSIFASLNAFSEGHRIFKVGPGYARPQEQTTLYEVRNVLRNSNGATFPVATKLDVAEANVINVSTKIPDIAGKGFGVTLRPNGRSADGFFLEPGYGKPTIPKGGWFVYGTGKAADFLMSSLRVGAKLNFDTEPVFVPISERPEQQIPLMMNPLDPRVRNYALDIVKEVSAYHPDGIIYDDRLRFAGINADFSPVTRETFEKKVGQKLKWPDNVLKFTLNPNLVRGVRPGPFYDRWITFRAQTMTDFLRRVRQELPAGQQLGVYAGSWYGEYSNLGSNWASPTAAPGFWYATPDYRLTGFAKDIDFLVTGCYYPVPTIYRAMEQGRNAGATVEAAGALSNQLVRDHTWTYAGIMLSDFKDNPEGLQDALSAACASTQGVMVFDLSHDIEPMWPIFRQAFSVPRSAPNMVNGLRQKVAAMPASRQPIVISNGSAGTGQ